MNIAKHLTDFNKQVFASAFVSGLLLLASAFFYGQLGIDNELTMLQYDFDAVGRGMYLLQIVLSLLPGQIGISFAPMFLGLILYSISIVLIINLWELKDTKVAIVSAAIIASFPYFASMMAFDVVQVAYPLGFIFITCSIACCFTERYPYYLAPLSGLLFALAFSCYQGVSTSYITIFSSTIVIRFLNSINHNASLNNIVSIYIPRFLATGVFGGIIYLLSNKIIQNYIPHKDWEGGYKVQLDFNIFSRDRFSSIVENIFDHFAAHHQDLPRFSALVFIILVAFLIFYIFTIKDISLFKRSLINIITLLIIFIAPFWIVFVQSNLLTPRSLVGLGVIYGMLYAALYMASSSTFRSILTGVAIFWIISFIFKGNEMYFCEYLKTRNEQVAVNRLISRIDVIAANSQLSSPTSVVFIGCPPTFKKISRFNTLGFSALSWGGGDSSRQTAVFNNLGLDDIKIGCSPMLLEEIKNYTSQNNIPKYPHAKSVFIYKSQHVVVNFGS
jgi:hypothetical protein